MWDQIVGCTRTLSRYITRVAFPQEFPIIRKSSACLDNEKKILGSR